LRPPPGRRRPRSRQAARSTACPPCPTATPVTWPPSPRSGHTRCRPGWRAPSTLPRPPARDRATTATVWSGSASSPPPSRSPPSSPAAAPAGAAGTRLTPAPLPTPRSSRVHNPRIPGGMYSGLRRGSRGGGAERLAQALSDCLLPVTELLPEEPVDPVLVVLGVAIAATIVQHGISAFVPPPPVPLDDDPLGLPQSVHAPLGGWPPRQRCLEPRLADACQLDRSSHPPLELGVGRHVPGTPVADDMAEQLHPALARPAQLLVQRGQLTDHEPALRRGHVHGALETCGRRDRGKVRIGPWDRCDRESVDAHYLLWAQVGRLMDETGTGPLVVPVRHSEHGARACGEQRK